MVVLPINISRCDAAKTFLQSAFWGRFKSRFGWTALAFNVEPADGVSFPLLVLTRKIARVFSFAYIPWGPEIEEASGISRDNLPAETAAALKPYLKNYAFVRFDLPFFIEDKTTPRYPFLKKSSDVQAPCTVHINLTLSLEEMLLQMKPKWRYNIRLGGKKTFVLRCGAERLPDFYALLLETAHRDKIFVHDYNYYSALFEEAAENGPQINLYIALFEEKPIAGIITLFRGAEAVYLYGASSNEYRNLMAPYALQWQAICDAKDAGCTYYDLFGIPPDDNPNHPMAGLYRFKTGFGGKIIRRPGCYDYDYNRAAAFFRCAEKLRKWAMKKR